MEALRRECAGRPDDEDLRRRLRVAERLLAKNHYYDVAREFGRLVGRAAEGSPEGRLLVMTGGDPGIMEAANRGAFDAAVPSAAKQIAHGGRAHFFSLAPVDDVW